MPTPQTALPMIERRAIEAQILLRVYQATLERFDADTARGLLEAAIDADAHGSGRAFAAAAPGGIPTLAHFATVLDRWREGDVLRLDHIELTERRLSFSVTRCGYVERYTALGIPAELHGVLSCRRDQAFAAGYSPQLRMHRPDTLAKGAAACGFVFEWAEK